MTKNQKNKIVCEVRNSVLSEAHKNFSKGLNAHALYKMNDKVASSDLVQDTFTKTWTYMVKGGQIDKMKAFLYHILNNLIIDEYRKTKSSSLDTLLESGYEPSVDDHHHMMDTIDGQKAMTLISKLSDKYRKIMHMKYVDELSIEEMSALTGQTRNAVAVQLHRGLDKLRLLYENSFSTR